MLILDIFVAVVLVCDLVHVLVDLLRCGVVIRPFWVGSEAVCVVMCRYVTLAAGVSISTTLSRELSIKCIS
jgi:hypothetical protein